MTFKDLFSTQSADYARYRPSYPPALFSWLASVAPGRALAVDVATGSGQAALALAAHFAQVVAADASADLLTAAQAFHWFRPDAFFADAARVLRPGGVLAVWSYGLTRITPAVDALVQHLYGDVLGSYWEPERRLVEEGYASVRF